MSYGSRLCEAGDIHTDHAENLEWVRGLSDEQFRYLQRASLVCASVRGDGSHVAAVTSRSISTLVYTFRSDALIVAGDVADDSRVLEETLRLLKAKFAEVYE